jgi:DNA primase
MGYAPDGWQNLQTVFSDYNADELKLSRPGHRERAGRRYDRFRDRLMIPIINQKGDIIAFGGRIIDQGEPKYLNSPETPLFEKGRELFGLPQARAGAARDRHRHRHRRLHGCHRARPERRRQCRRDAGHGNHARTCKLLRQVDRIVFCFDGDNAGRKAAWRALENSWKRTGRQQAHRLRLPAPGTTTPTAIIAPTARRSLTDWSSGHAAFRFPAARTGPALRPDQLRRQGAADLRSQSRCYSSCRPAAPPATGQTPGRSQRFAQSEVERLCDLRSYSPAAPRPAAHRASR